TCSRHFALLVESKGPIVGSNMMRKHFGWYIKNFAGAAALRQQLVTAKDKKAMEEILQDVMKNVGLYLKESA
nr:tRNA-dihydrouridine synthase [Candidatus Poribacteria bacterium]